MKFIRFVQWQSALNRGVKRSLLILIIPLLAACENISPKTVEQLAIQPQAHHAEGRASVYVRGIETKGDLIIVDLLAINAHDREIELGDEQNPLVLVDSNGKEYPAAEREISLAPHTSNNLTVAFWGAAKKDLDLTLKINSDRDHNLAPQINVDEIPFKKGKRVEFATYQPRQVNFQDRVFHHPNGLTFTVESIKFDEQNLEVAFDAVNGYSREVNLATLNSDLPFLEDERGNRYNYIPIDGNKFTIPARQSIRGILRFAGRVPEAVNQLSLYINEGGSNDDRTTRPKIVLPDLAGPSSESATALSVGEGEALAVSSSTPEFLATEQNLNLQANHSDGSVMRLTKIAVTEDYIETDLTVVNGYRNTIALNPYSHRDMVLRDNLGNTYHLAPPPQNPQVKIDSGTTLKGKFRFSGRIAPNAETLTLITNDGSQNYTNTIHPYMAIANIPVANTGEEANSELVTDTSSQPVDNTASLPSELTLDLQANHANGSVVRLNKISFQEDSIITDLAITNGHKYEIRLNGNRDLRLRDNLGNIYNLATIPQNPEVNIAPGQTLNGKFVFLGRIAPQASSLTLITNEKYGSERDSSTRPKITIADIPLESASSSQIASASSNESNTNKSVETAANKTNSLPRDLAIDRQANHANGSVMQLKALSFQDDSILADVSVTNGYKNEILLNANRGFLLQDNIGNVYYLATIPQNPQVKISPGQTLNGKFVFLGRISPRANSLTLVTNNKYGSDRDYATRPKMAIDNIALN